MPSYALKSRRPGTLLVLFLLGLLAGGTLLAQPVRDRVDHRGQEFRLAFLHTNGFDEYPLLSIVVSCEKPTSGTITYLSSGKTVNVTIPQANTATRFDLDTFDLVLPDPRVQPVSGNTILVRFNDEVTLYGFNTQRWSSDAFLALPKDVTGTDHMILSYPNTLSPDPASAFVGGSDFPSQLAVIATEDNTIIDVNPTVRFTSRTNADPFTVRLDEGQVFFAQAFGRIGQDVSGTTIRSNRPIVVYGSHQRTNIPFDQAVGRNHLIEQLPPVSRWGTRCFVTPHFQLQKTIRDPNLIRVIAATDNTVLKIDSVVWGTLQARRVVEIPLDHAAELTASGPILVAQYQASTADEQFITQPNDSIGDPFMQLVFAPAQFDSAYAFESINTKDFNFHYINVTIPTARISTLTLDGRALIASFQRIGNTSYSYAQIEVERGTHYIRAEAPFGLLVYGYGPYNGYGHPGGIVFDTLFKDQSPPEIVWRDTCNGVAGEIIERTPLVDFGVESLKLESGSLNVALETDPFTPGDTIVPFRLRLVDPFMDGVAKLVGVDTAGLDRRYTIIVKGFTVALGAGQTTPRRLDTLSSLNGIEFCRTITITNYGLYPQRVGGLKITPLVAGLRSDNPFPAEIAPGASLQFSICYQHVGDTAFDIQVAIDNGCIERDIAIVPLVSGIDSLLPHLESEFDACQADRTIRLSEYGAGNSGVKSVQVVDQHNAEITIREGNNLPAREVNIKVRRVDPFIDMLYTIIITDRVGNATVVSDTVGGFTLAVRRSNASQVGIRMNETFEYSALKLGGEACDTLYLENYGILPLSLNGTRLAGNLEYSIPPEQLPIVLMPGERRPLLVCIHPRSSGTRVDTLIIDYHCGNPQERVQLRTLVNSLEGGGSDRCGNQLRFEIDGLVKRNFLEAPIPNPVTGDQATITLGLDSPQTVTLSISDALGNEVARLFQEDNLPGGIIRIDAAIGDLPAGHYFLRMTTSTGSAITEGLVISR